MSTPEILKLAKRFHASRRGDDYIVPIRKIADALGVPYAAAMRKATELGAEKLSLGDYLFPAELLDSVTEDADTDNNEIPAAPPKPVDPRENGSHNRRTSDSAEHPKAGIAPKTSTALVPVESREIPPVAAETDTGTEVPPEIVLEPNEKGVYEAVAPAPSKINAAVIPAELKTRRQWVMWRHETRDGKPTKIPYQTNGRRAQSNNPTTWTSLENALRHVSRFDGIGYVFSENDPYCGIDIDNCLDANREAKSWAEPILKELDSVAYREISPSGVGVKAWTTAQLPAYAGNKVSVDDGHLEIYDHSRYFTMTSDPYISGCSYSGLIYPGQHVVDWLIREYFPKPNPPSEPQPRSPASPLFSSTGKLIAEIRNSKQGTKFDKLFNGNWTDYKVGTEGASRADEALCCMIAFWEQDPAAIDAVFRQSKLMRPKWDEKHRGDGATYGQMTIEFALNNLRETYKPRRRHKRRRKRQRYQWL